MNGSGVAPQYSGEAQPIVHDGVIYVITGADDVFALSVETGEILWQYLRAARSQDHVGLLRLDEPRRRHRRRQDLRRQARRPARRARSTHGPRGLVDPGRALARRLLDHERAALLRRHGHHGFLGRRDRRARPRQGVRRRRRQAALDVLHDPGSRRGRPRHLAARQRSVDARRRDGVADAGRRSRARAHLFLDRQSRARLQRRRACRRQPVLGVDRRDRGAHGQIPLALPRGPPRPLGLRRAESRRAVRRCDRRTRAQRARASRQDGLGVHPRPRDRRAADRHRGAARAAGAAAGDGRHAAVPDRRRDRAAASRHRARGLSARESGPHLHAVRRRQGHDREPEPLRRRELAAELVRSRAAIAVRLRVGRRRQLHRRRPRLRDSARRATLRGRRRRLRAAAAHGHLRRRRRHDEQARVALPLVRAVLQRLARDGRRPRVRRPQRRPPDGARLGHGPHALGVPDRRRHECAGEHVRARRQAVRRRAVGRQRAGRRAAAATAFGCSGSTARCRRPRRATPRAARRPRRRRLRRAPRRRALAARRRGSIQASVRRVPRRGRPRRARRRRAARPGQRSRARHGHGHRRPRQHAAARRRADAQSRSAPSPPTSSTEFFK